MEEEEDKELIGEEKATYQTQAARANYLCMDRPDIGFAVKECMRKLSAPTEKDNAAMKKIARYLNGAPRVVSTFPYGDRCRSLVVEGDSDHAGCLRTRKCHR